MQRLCRGVTLIELLVAMAIMAVLISLILPGYQKQLRDTRRSAVQAQLLKIMARQEQYFFHHKRYAASFNDLDLPADPDAINAVDSAMSVIAQDSIYRITLVSQRLDYTLTAMPQGDQAADRLCGVLSINAAGLREVTGDGTVRDCW